MYRLVESSSISYARPHLRTHFRNFSAEQAVLSHFMSLVVKTLLLLGYCSVNLFCVIKAHDERQGQLTCAQKLALDRAKPNVHRSMNRLLLCRPSLSASSAFYEGSSVKLTQPLSPPSQPHPRSPPPYLPLPSSPTTRTGVSRQNERTASPLFKSLGEGHRLGCEVMQNTSVGSQHNWSRISG